MLKKILTFSLALIMLASVALVSTGTTAFAEEEVTVETILIDGYSTAGSQIITYNPDGEIGVRNQAAWVLYKFTLPGTYESVSNVSLNVTYAGNAGTAHLWVHGLTQEYWDAAKAVSGTTISTDLFVSPLNNLEKYKVDRHSQTTATVLNVDLTETSAVEQAKSGVIYLAMTIDSSSGNNGGRYGTISGVELSVEGVAEGPSEPDVEERTVETIHIDAYSTAGSQIITYNRDGEIWVRNQAAWVLYKFTLPGTYESVSNVSLNVTYAGNAGTAHLWVHGLTQEYWDAAKAVSGTTISTDLFVSPLNNLEKYKVDRHSQTTATVLNVDLTETSAVEQAKSGVIYLAMTIDSSSGNNGGRYGTISGVELSVEGVTEGPSEPAVDDFSDSKITWDNATGAYTVTTATQSGTAMLIAASFNGATMVDAKIDTVDAATAQNGVISGTITGLQAGTTVKIFLWDSTTLAPAIGVSSF